MSSRSTTVRTSIGNFAGVLVLAVAGCVTAVVLPPGPDPAALSVHPNAPRVLVPQPEDRRLDKKWVGSLPLLDVALKEDPTELLGKELAAALHEQGLNPIPARVSAGKPSGYFKAVDRAQADGILLVAIRSISVTSFNALLEPPKAVVTLEANLVEPNGSTLETVVVAGEAQRKINGSTADRAVGLLVGEAISDAARRLIRREEMRLALAELDRSERLGYHGTQ